MTWSMRFYEAILAGSIPVIHSFDTDLTGDYPFWYKHIGYTYFFSDQVVNLTLTSAELQNIADQNYELFLKYQTWIQGDQAPTAYCAYKDSCLPNQQCMTRCLRQDKYHDDGTRNMTPA